MSTTVDERASVQNAWLTQLFPLRVWAERDQKYAIYAAYCVETGSVTTADDMDTALDMMRELLEDEISRAIATKNFGNLFSTPAPIEIREKWTMLAKENPNAIAVMRLNINVPSTGRKDAGHTRDTRVAVLRAAA